jgi:hypothetical protein
MALHGLLQGLVYLFLITFFMGRRFGIFRCDENIAGSSNYGAIWFNWYFHVLKTHRTYFG